MKKPVVALVVALGLLAVASSAQFASWSSPVNLGPVVNSKGIDQCVCISNDGLSLYFSSNRNAKWGMRDLFVSRRTHRSAPWGPPQVVPAVSSPHDESCPALSLDQLKLYFASNRPGGCGGTDFYVSERSNPYDDFGWGAPVNLGCESDGHVNSAASEQTPSFFEAEDGTQVMYFTSTRGGGNDVYASLMGEDGTFGPADPVGELNTPYGELGPALRHDGLEIIFGSTRPGGLGGYDLWTATRRHTWQPWSTPQNVSVLNSSSNEVGRFSFSYDGREFYFGSDRPGGYGSRDLYYAKR